MNWKLGVILFLHSFGIGACGWVGTGLVLQVHDQGDRIREVERLSLYSHEMIRQQQLDIIEARLRVTILEQEVERRQFEDRRQRNLDEQLEATDRRALQK